MNFYFSVLTPIQYCYTLGLFEHFNLLAISGAVELNREIVNDPKFFSVLFNSNRNPLLESALTLLYYLCSSINPARFHMWLSYFAENGVDLNSCQDWMSYRNFHYLPQLLSLRLNAAIVNPKSKTSISDIKFDPIFQYLIFFTMIQQADYLSGYDIQLSFGWLPVNQLNDQLSGTC